MNQWTPKTTLIVAGVAVVGLWYLKGRAGEAVQAVNPMNHGNVFNQAFEGWWDGGADGQGTPGADFFEWEQEINEKYYKYSPLGVYDTVTGWFQ